MKRITVTVEKLSDSTARRWISALWWPAILIAQAVWLWASSSTRYVDDGRSDVTLRFGSWLDVVYLVVIFMALTLEGRRLVEWLVTPRIVDY